MTSADGAGLLYTTEVEYADLGEHAGRSLRGRVEHRVLRLGLGGRSGLRMQLGVARPVAVEVRPSGQPAYELPIAAPPEPRLAAVRRMVVCWLLAELTLGIVRRLRADRRHRKEHRR